MGTRTVTQVPPPRFALDGKTVGISIQHLQPLMYIAYADAIAQIAKMDGMPDGAAEALTVKHISLDRPITDKVGEINQMLGEEHSLIMLGELSVADGLAEMASRAAEIMG